MIYVVLIFAALAVLAAVFAALPYLTGRGGVSIGMAGAVIAGVLVIGLGSYFALGRPQLAVRSFAPLSSDDFPGLIAMLAERIRQRPNDLAGWTLLGRGYVTLGQNAEGAKALARAIDLAQAQGKPSAALYSDYGEALLQSEGPGSQNGQNAFNQALALDPKEPKARYYLGAIAAMRGKTQDALALWQGLLADAPPNAPWRQTLVDQIAALNAAAVSTGQAQVPDIQAMVAGLAARLKDNPHDLEGWQRLIRAYAVLGDKDKADTAMRDALAAFPNDASARASLAQAAAPAK
jgi:cytochrome c-type biogenesis protein CcmH